VHESSVLVLLNKNTGKLETFNIHTGELVATEGTVPSTFVYSVEMGEAICNLIREGRTVHEIATLKGMPPLHLIYRWRNAHPDFSQKLKAAKHDRADYFHDKAVEVLEKSDGFTKDEAPMTKLRFDGYLKLAEKNNPEEYTDKNKQVAGSSTTVIMIDTGIRRHETIIEGEVLDEKSKSPSGQRDGVGGDTRGSYYPIGAEVGEDTAEGSGDGSGSGRGLLIDGAFAYNGEDEEIEEEIGEDDAG